MADLPGWIAVYSGPNPGALNMAEDEARFAAFRPDCDAPVLRFYGWSRPCISLGYSVDESILSGVRLHSHVDVVKRPTGGGCVLHEDDLSFSVIVPAGIWGGLRACYRRLGEILVESLSPFGLPGLALAQGVEKSHPNWCFSAPDDYDIVAGGKKLCGIAQRRKRDKLLFQGALVFTPPCLETFTPDPAGWTLHTENSAGLRRLCPDIPAPETVARQIASGFSRAIGIKLEL